MSNKIKFDRETYLTNIEALKSITGIKLSNEIAKELSEKIRNINVAVLNCMKR